jgi:hypothetical protein
MDDTNQKAAFEFLKRHLADQGAFSKDELAKATGWSDSTVGTYISKQFKPFVDRIGKGKYRVNEGFRRFMDDFNLFRELVTQVRGIGDQGLCFYFNSHLIKFDTFLIDGLIIGVLGKNTDCHVIEFSEKSNGTLVRLHARDTADLVKVGDAMWERIWLAEKKAQETALVALTQTLGLPEISKGMSDLRAKVNRLELWGREKDVAEMFEDQAADHRKEKDSKLLRTWPQNIANAIGKKLEAKVGEEIGGTLSDSVRGLLESKR